MTPIVMYVCLLLTSVMIKAQIAKGSVQPPGDDENGFQNSELQEGGTGHKSKNDGITSTLYHSLSEAVTLAATPVDKATTDSLEDNSLQTEKEAMFGESFHPIPEPESYPEPTSEYEPKSEIFIQNNTRPECEPLSEASSGLESDSQTDSGFAEPESSMNLTSEPSAEPGSFVRRNTVVATLSILLGVILVTNITLMVTILKTKSLKKPTNMFILSLNSADICIALFVVPGMISGRFSELWMANIICRICHYFSHLSLAAASFSLVFISLDRFRAIVWPLKPKFTLLETSIVIACIWLLALVYGMRAPFLFSITPVDVRDDQGTLYVMMVCWVSQRHANTNSPLIIFDFIVVFALPALTIIASYSGLLYFVSKNSIRARFPKPDKRKNTKAFRLSILMISVFIICHLPVYSMRVYLDRGSPVITESQDMITAFDIISILNSVLNPVVYGFLNKQIRDAFFSNVLKSRINSKQPHNRIHPLLDFRGSDTSRVTTISQRSVFHGSISLEVSSFKKRVSFD